MNSERIETAKNLATELHEGQFRRDGTTPYIQHPAKVAEIVEQIGGGESEIIVAWLHDLLEDTSATETLVASMFNRRIAEAVNALTHREGESYEESIIRASSDAIAIKVKIADNLANLSDSPTRKQVAKYSASLIQLIAKL